LNDHYLAPFCTGGLDLGRNPTGFPTIFGHDASDGIPPYDGKVFFEAKRSATCDDVLVRDAGSDARVYRFRV
jgi:hypothetical protein